MNKFDINFRGILKNILDNGFEQENRTGINSIILPAVFLQHNMEEGFPLSTLRKMPFKSAAVELEGFIKGITSKKWYQDRNCNWWNFWCNPQKVPYGNDETTKKKMEVEDDLGEIYGAQWTAFRDPTVTPNGRQVNQLLNVIKTIKNNPTDRRMVVLNWNPLALDYQALPACHTQFMLNVINGRLNLSYVMRSCDMFIGNAIVTYALLLHLIAKECELKEGVLSAMWHNAHIYVNQVEAINSVFSREPFELPKIQTENFSSIFSWTHDQTKVIGYKAHERIQVNVAV